MPGVSGVSDTVLRSMSKTDLISDASKIAKKFDDVSGEVDQLSSLKSQLKNKLDTGDLRQSIIDAMPEGSAKRAALERRAKAENDVMDLTSKIDSKTIKKQDLQTELERYNKKIDQNFIDDAYDWMKTNPVKTFVIGGVAITASGLGIWAAIQAQNSKDTEREIIKVEYVETGLLASKKNLKITFQPEIAITKKDTLTITGTKTTPPFDGDSIAVTSVLSDSAITLTTSQNTTNLQPGGKIKVSTSVGNQIVDATTSGLKTVGEAAGTAAGAAGAGIAGGVGSGLESFFSNTSFMTIALIFVLIMLFK